MLMRGPVSSELMTASVALNHLIIVGRFEQLLISAKPDSPRECGGQILMHGSAYVSIVFLQLTAAQFRTF